MPTPSYNNASLDRNARSREWERTEDAKSLQAMQQAHGYEDEPSYEELMAGAHADLDRTAPMVHSLKDYRNFGVGKTADPDKMAPTATLGYTDPKTKKRVDSWQPYGYGDVAMESGSAAMLPLSFVPGPMGMAASGLMALQGLQVAADDSQPGLSRGLGGAAALGMGIPAVRGISKIPGVGKLAGKVSKFFGGGKPLRGTHTGPSYEIGTLGRVGVKADDEVGQLVRDPNYVPPVNPRSGETALQFQRRAKLSKAEAEAQFNPNQPTPSMAGLEAAGGPKAAAPKGMPPKAPVVRSRRPQPASEPITDPETMMLMGEIEAGASRAASQAAGRSRQAVPQTLWRGQRSAPAAPAAPAAQPGYPPNLTREDILEALAAGDESVKRQIMFGGVKMEKEALKSPSKRPGMKRGALPGVYQGPQ